MARVVGPRHPITLSLTPLGLDLALGALTVEAVSAGPVWQGGGYLLTDGAVYLQGPSGLPTGTSWEIVVWANRTTTTGSHSVYSLSSSGTQAAESYWTSSVQLRQRVKSTYYASAEPPFEATALTGHVLYLISDISGDDATPSVVVDGGTTRSGSSNPTARATPMTLRVASTHTYGAGAAGLRIYAVAFYARLLTDGERDSMASPGDLTPPTAQVNPLTVASDAWGCWDMRNAESDGAGGYRVPDLVLGDHTRDLAVVSGDLTDFGTGSFA